jgi:hypothetical protein
MLRKLLLGLACLLAACNAGMSELKPGVSTASDVRRAMGTPSYEWQEADGGMVWEFARGPTGTVTYMVRIGSDGILREIRQALNDATFANIRPGQTKEEIRRMLGRPAETMTFAQRQEEVWSWRYEPATGERWMFHVHFVLDGLVRTTSRNQVDTP